MIVGVIAHKNVNLNSGFVQIFWMQNSRLFPDFFQNNNFFFQTQG